MQELALCATRPHFTVFGFDIYYYAVCIVIGIILATVVVGLLFKRRNIPVDWTVDLLLCILPLGIIGARTFYVLTDPSTSIAEWFTGFRDGGLSILGGVMFGALGVVLFSVIHKIPFLRVADCLVPGVILAQGIGRWGNFFNQEVYGAEVVNESLQWFPFAVHLDNGEWHYAFFFYESMLNLIIFALLFTLMWKFRKKPHGIALSLYCIGYGTVRSIMEPLRDPQFILGDEFPISQFVSLCILAAGIILLLSVLLYNRYKNGRAIGAVVGEPLAVMPVYYTREQRKKMEEERAARARALQQKAAQQQAAAPQSADAEAKAAPSANAPTEGAAPKGGADETPAGGEDRR